MRVSQASWLIIILLSLACTQNRTSDPMSGSSSGTSSAGNARPDDEQLAPVVCGRVVELKEFIDGESRTSLMVQKDAVIIDKSGLYVSKLFENGDRRFVVEIPVKTGRLSSDGWIEIIPILRDGDQVVVRADERLASGREVDVTKVLGGHPSGADSR